MITVAITKRGQPIARLIPEVGANKAAIDDAILQLKSLRKETTLGGLSWKELRDEGRKE